MSLSILAWDHPRATAPLAACSDAWAALTGESLTIATRSLRSFGDDVPRAGDHDLVLIDHPHVGRAAGDGAILALDDLLDGRRLALLAADSAGLSHDSYQYGGHHWAVAVDASCQALAMARPALERSGRAEGSWPPPEGSRPPQTWDDVLAMARRHPAQVALPLQPAHAISALLSLIGTREPIAGASGLAGDRVLRWAVGTLAQLAAAGPAEAFGWEPPDVLTRLAEGQLICVPLVYAYTGYDVVWSGAPAAVPGGRPGSILGGVGAAVLAGSPDPPAAARLAAWLGSSDVQRTLVLGAGGQPATASAWSAPGADPMYAAVLPTLESGRLRPRDPWWPGFQRASGELLARELEARTDPGVIAQQLAGLYHDHREGTP